MTSVAWLKRVSRGVVVYASLYRKGAHGSRVGTYLEFCHGFLESFRRLFAFLRNISPFFRLCLETTLTLPRFNLAHRTSFLWRPADPGRRSSVRYFSPMPRYVFLRGFLLFQDAFNAEELAVLDALKDSSVSALRLRFAKVTQISSYVCLTCGRMTSV